MKSWCFSIVFPKKVGDWKLSRSYRQFFYFFWVNLIVLRVSFKNIDFFRKKSRKKKWWVFWIASRSQSKLLMGGFEKYSHVFKSQNFFTLSFSHSCWFLLFAVNQNEFHRWSFMCLNDYIINLIIHYIFLN